MIQNVMGNDSTAYGPGGMYSSYKIKYNPNYRAGINHGTSISLLPTLAIIMIMILASSVSTR
jgi:hypothetical protein